MPIILGIESTAHTFGVGVVKDGKILSNVKKSYTTESGGIIPMEAAKHHNEVKREVYSEALKDVGIKEDGIDAIAFSQGPGLAPCLLEGMKFAKELSNKLGKSIVPVNHCVAHLEIGKITKAKNPVMLYVSGANTQIIAYSSGKYRIFGETLDVGVGNFIDNFGRYAGIGFPAGPKIEELARNSNKYVELPYNVKGMDITLSGILTKLKNMIESKDYKIEDLAYSMQETVFAMLVETAERALAHTGKSELLLGGGVGCNKRLQEMCEIMCKERGAKFFCPPASLLVDNGAMIAYLGEIMFNAGIKEKDPDIMPRQRTDQVDVKWR
ncbi:tRNA (adenosine(37)-N6)-threonylcarbamoyltransferase complex transferase subunit TsaD [Candidatus Pacearchaeota archaeon]|nr:tRNA (adenosine(37)-N6)-threonylcarbamoyltransferase complex transferase subunit TsaD [Candidatus Pacearchaeota archaeon]